ncbi:hypothetical protein TWF718_000597 [Orbilia javanica]|uniref:Uncharacterized protein n=1 Tax=Orbilia javanica TaxID=47235 RepID=A0AAN8N897_9PEZI
MRFDLQKKSGRATLRSRCRVDCVRLTPWYYGSEASIQSAAKTGHDMLNLSVLTLSNKGDVLIPLSSPYKDQNSNIFDSLFWLKRSRYVTLPCRDYESRGIDTCLYIYPTPYTGMAKPSHPDENGLAFNLLTARSFMRTILNGPLHFIQDINGNTSSWEGVDYMVSLANMANRIKGYLGRRLNWPQASATNSYNDPRKIFENFNWKEATDHGHGKAATMLTVVSKASSQYGISMQIRPHFSVFGSSMLFGVSKSRHGSIIHQIYNLQVARRYVSEVLQYCAYDAPHAYVKLPKSVTQSIRVVVQAFQRSGFDAIIHYQLGGGPMAPDICEGRTLLQVAADWFNDKELLKILVEEGGDVNAPGALGTALQSCCRRPTTTRAVGVTRIEAVRFLVEAGADVNPLDPDNTRPQFTPLDGAIFTGDLAVARYLLEKGAFIDLDTIKYAVSYGRLDMVSLLVQFDMKFREPALEFARLYGEYVIEEYLMERNLGRGLLGVPSEYVMFSRVDELDD